MDLRLKNIDYQLTANVKGGVMDTTKIVRHTPPLIEIVISLFCCLCFFGRAFMYLFSELLFHRRNSFVISVQSMILP